MAQSKYYSPRLQRSLISPLYHAAKSRGVPMTALASGFVADGLARLNAMQTDDCVVAENAGRYDPSARKE